MISLGKKAQPYEDIHQTPGISQSLMKGSSTLPLVRVTSTKPGPRHDGPKEQRTLLESSRSPSTETTSISLPERLDTTRSPTLNFYSEKKRIFSLSERTYTACQAVPTLEVDKAPLYIARHRHRRIVPVQVEPQPSRMRSDCFHRQSSRNG